MISPDRVILDIDNPDWTAAHGLARDFRSCTRTVAVGPTLFAAHGPSAFQSLQELQYKLIVNVCMYTQTPRMLRTLYQFLIAPGVIGVSIMATKDTDYLEAVVELAERSLTVTKRVDRPAILACMATPAVKQRRREIRALTNCCQYSGISGIIAAHEDMPHVQSVAKPHIALLSMSKRRPRDYRLQEEEDTNGKPGITELLNGGMTHVLLGADSLDYDDPEWIADMATKELAEWGRGKGTVKL